MTTYKEKLEEEEFFTKLKERVKEKITKIEFLIGLFKICGEFQIYIKMPEIFEEMKMEYQKRKNAIPNDDRTEIEQIINYVNSNKNENP